MGGFRLVYCTASHVQTARLHSHRHVHARDPYQSHSLSLKPSSLDSPPIFLLFTHSSSHQSHFFPTSGSSNIPSASNRLLASSSAQVCILYSVSPHPFPSYCPSPSPTPNPILAPLKPGITPKPLGLRPSPPKTHCTTLLPPTPATRERGKTYEVSGLKIHPTTPNAKLPKNP